MKIENNVVSFEVDEKTLNKMQLAINAADLNADEEFKKWVNNLSEIALRKISGEKVTNIFENIKSTLSMDNQTKQRIDKWAKNQRGANYGIIKAFFQSEESHDGFALKNEMEQFYNDNPSNSSPFLGNFRMMCCDSAFCSQIFFYDKNTTQVTLNDKYREYILDKKEDFYKI